MRLANGIVLDKDTTLEVKFSALRREVRIQMKTGRFHESRNIPIACQIKGQGPRMIQVSIPASVPLKSLIAHTGGTYQSHYGFYCYCHLSKEQMLTGISRRTIYLFDRFTSSFRSSRKAATKTRKNRHKDK